MKKSIFSIYLPYHSQKEKRGEGIFFPSEVNSDRRDYSQQIRQSLLGKLKMKWLGGCGDRCSSRDWRDWCRKACAEQAAVKSSRELPGWVGQQEPKTDSLTKSLDFSLWDEQSVIYMRIFNCFKHITVKDSTT